MNNIAYNEIREMTEQLKEKALEMGWTEELFDYMINPHEYSVEMFTWIMRDGYGVNTRAIHALLRVGITSDKEIRAMYSMYGRQFFLKIRNLGEKTCRELEEKMELNA